MSGIFQEMLSNQHCTFLSFSYERTESVSGWLCNSDSHNLKKSLVENRQRKKLEKNGPYLLKLHKPRKYFVLLGELMTAFLKY